MSKISALFRLIFTAGAAMSSIPTASTPSARKRGPLLLIALLFMGPFVAAYSWYFYYPQLRIEGRTNYGHLIEPARPLGSFTGAAADGSAVGREVLEGHWTLLYVGGAHCSTECLRSLYLARQVRTRLARDRTRVQRIYVAPDAEALAEIESALGSDHPDLQRIRETGAAGARLRDFVGPLEGGWYLLDPNGNWVMWYQDDFEPAGVYKDLRQLLKLSQIG